MDFFLLRSSTRSRASEGEWLSIGQHETVLNSDSVYWEIHKDFSSCKMNVLRINRIIQLETSDIVQTFSNEQKLVGSRNSSVGANVENLYYGSGSDGLISYCQDGLDHRSDANKKLAYFGNGIYFSNSPERCRVDAERTKNSSYFLLRCKVILGECKKYPDLEMDTGLVREPEKGRHPTTGAIAYYDSVVGRPSGNYTEYVVYEKRRALVEYVIEYKCEQPLPELPTVKKISNPSTKQPRHRQLLKTNEKKREPSADSSSSADLVAYTSDDDDEGNSADEECYSNASNDEHCALSESPGRLTTDQNSMQLSEDKLESRVVHRVESPSAAARVVTTAATAAGSSTPAAAGALPRQPAAGNSISAAVPAVAAARTPPVPAARSSISAEAAAVAPPPPAAVGRECDDEDDIAAVMKVFDELVKTFIEVTAADSRVAREYLIEHKFNMVEAMNSFLGN